MGKKMVVQKLEESWQKFLLTFENILGDYSSRISSAFNVRFSLTLEFY